jgi:2,3-bisphosphoglycerate-dependent phosphoglycerate mutase
MQLYLVRHGQSENNLLWDNTSSSVGRHEDPALTGIGRKQAERVAEFFSQPFVPDAPFAQQLQNRNGFSITHIYASLMDRAVATGSYIARALALPLLAWEDLHEGGGIYRDNEATGEREGRPGKHRAYFRENYPELVLAEDVHEAGWWNRPYESKSDLAVRAHRVYDDLLTRHGATDDRVIAITHGEFYTFLLSAMFNLPASLEGRFWFPLNNTAVTRVDFRAGQIVPVYMNRVDFLPAELLT